LVDDQSFAFDNFLPYFARSAEYHPPTAPTRLASSTTLYNATVWSDDGGPLQVGYPAWVNPISSWIAKGLEVLGLRALSGLSDGDIFGYGYTAFTLDPRTQTRSSSETSYLREALLETTNLAIYKNTLAKKVLFDADKRANGVVVDSGGTSYELKATKEAIVSAGAIRSPQMLMVSGIGPSKVLSDLSIPVLSDLPGVGQNMGKIVIWMDCRSEET
jgi:choline dehydrogenase-like flavoprotein